MQIFTFPVRVYIEDTDAGGIVFYANFLKFMERARTEWMRSLGIALDEWQQQHRVLFVVRKVDIEYLAPARQDDQLSITMELIKLKGASANCRQVVSRGDTTLTTASVLLVCVNVDTLSACAIPTPIKEAMTVER